MEEYVGAWLYAPDDVWDETRPHTEVSYNAYLHWYLTRTRPYVTLARVDDGEHQHSPTSPDTYPLHRDQGQRGAVRFFAISLRYIFFVPCSYYYVLMQYYFTSSY